MGSRLGTRVAVLTRSAILMLEDDQLVFRLKGLDTTTNSVTDLEARTTLTADDIADFVQVVAVVKPSRPANSRAFVSLYVNGERRDIDQAEDNEKFLVWINIIGSGDRASGLGGAINDTGSDPPQPNLTGFDGQIAEMNFYHFRALSDVDVLNNYLAVASPTTQYGWVTGEPLAFLNFATGEPSNNGEVVVMTGIGDGTSRWSVEDETTSWRGIIELESLDNLPLRFDDGLDITVNNVAPVADAGLDRTATTGDVVSLDGMFTDAGVDDTHSFLWTIESVATIGNVPVANSTNEDFDFHSNSPGEFIATFSVTDDDGAVHTDSARLTISGPVVAPSVESVDIDDGTGQRSMIRTLTVTFDSVVTLDSGAFVLTDDGGQTIATDVGVVVINNKTVATLTFIGNDIVGGSLADRDYTLTIDKDKVSVGSNSMAADHTDDFFRFFGDSNGDRDVNGADFSAFLATYRKTTASASVFSDDFDFDSDGDVDATDFSPFLGNYRKTLV